MNSWCMCYCDHSATEPKHRGLCPPVKHTAFAVSQPCLLVPVLGVSVHTCHACAVKGVLRTACLSLYWPVGNNLFESISQTFNPFHVYYWAYLRSFDVYLLTKRIDCCSYHKHGIKESDGCANLLEYSHHVYGGASKSSWYVIKQ